MFKSLLVAAFVASLAGTASAQTVGGIAAPSAAAPKATATTKVKTTSVAPKAVATVAPSATPVATLAPAPAKSFVLPTSTPAPTPKPVSAVGGNGFDLYATVPVSENNSNKNLGLAVGYRLVRLGDLSFSPLVNLNYIQNNPTAQPGLALTTHVGRNYDFGVAEIVRPCGYEPAGAGKMTLVCDRSFSMNRASYETSVVFGVRF